MKTTHILGILLLGVVLAIVVSFYGNTSRYVSFKEAEQLAIKHPDRDYHVVSRLDTTKPMVYDPIKDPNYFEFYAIDSLGEGRKVVYRNAKPQDLERTDKIVLIGKAQDGYFLAVDILKKCPSKYEKKDGDLVETKEQEP